MSFEADNANQITEQDICPRACQRLWCAVIDEQFRLAVSPVRIDRPFEVSAARSWFGTRDFFMACALAGLDGAWVLRGVRHRLELQGVA